MVDTVTDLKTGQVSMFMYGNEAAEYMESKQNGYVVDDTVNVPRSEYEELLDNDAFLDCLFRSGVDSWEGFSEAQELFDLENEEDEDS